jgi:hypothetical protein
MSQIHTIGRQIIALSLPSAERAYALQQAFSDLYGRSIVPAMESLFDRLVANDETLRIHQLQLDLGHISEKQLQSADFIHLLIQKLEIALKEILQSADTPLVRMPLRQSHFEQWLYFLQHGQLPWQAATPDRDWHKNVLDTLGLEQAAVEQLRYLLATQPTAFQRLLLQYDALFLQTMIELFTGFSQRNLPKGIREIMRVFQQLKKIGDLPSKKIFTKNVINRPLELFCWQTMLTQVIVNRQKQTPEQLLQHLLQQKEWAILLKFLVSVIQQQQPSFPILYKIITLADFQSKITSADSNAFVPPSPQQSVETKFLKKRADADQFPLEEEDKLLHPPEASFDAPQIAPAVSPLSSAAGELAFQESVQEKWTPSDSTDQPVAILPEESLFVAPRFALNKIPADDIQLKFAAFFAQLQNAPTPTPPVASTAPDSATGYFIRSAGVVLLHPFLAHFFKKLKLTEAGDFKNEKARHKAAYLIHFLATGEPQPPEYALVLPKLLCGIPLNLPLDHRLKITKRDQAEAENLLQATIEHWGALGKASPAALREGFLQRAGKLEHRQTWHLQVERNTIDILLDRLPWNLSLLKLPWMEEILKVEWR